MRKSKEEKKATKGEIFTGAGLILLGILLTLGSYCGAPEGGSYFIYWGLMIYGIYLIGKRASPQKKYDLSKKIYKGNSFESKRKRANYVL